MKVQIVIHESVGIIEFCSLIIESMLSSKQRNPNEKETGFDLA